jgi:hypothetical protein
MIGIEDVKIISLESHQVLVVQLDHVISTDIRNRVKEMIEHEAPILKDRLLIIDKSVSLAVIERN